MVGYYKYRRYIYLAVFCFVLGCTLTNFFVKIDNECAHSRPNVELISVPMLGAKLSNQVVDSPAVSEYFIVVIVISSPKNLNTRNTIRATWFNLCSENAAARCYFVVGSKDITVRQRSHLAVEQEKNSDLIILSDIVDSYDSLSLKVLASIVWIETNIQNYRYILKCDDDSFVQVDKVITELETSFDNDKGKRLYWGFFYGKAHVQKIGKWQQESFDLCDRYIPYALGGGYILSRNLVSFISRNSNDLRIFNSEDVSMGVWLAPVKVHRQHDCRFDTEYKSRGCSNKYLVTHKQSHEDMRDLWESIQDTEQLCAKEFQSRSSYNYNWTVPPSQCCFRVSNDLNIF